MIVPAVKLATVLTVLGFTVAAPHPDTTRNGLCGALPLPDGIRSCAGSRFLEHVAQSMAIAVTHLNIVLLLKDVRQYMDCVMMMLGLLLIL